MSIAAAHGLTKSYGSHTVLDHVDVSFEATEKVGLVGLNGQGKSTLARLLAGQEAADTGELMVRRDAKVVYLDQAPEFAPDATALDVVLGAFGPWRSALGTYEQANLALTEHPQDAVALQTQQLAEAELMRLGGWDLRHRAESMLGHVGLVDAEQRVAHMSGGQRRRAALAAALVAPADLLILDEPTNHLDLTSIEWLENHLTHELDCALLLVTHDRYLLDRVVTRTLELDRGKLYSYAGGYGQYLEAKQARLEHETRSEANRQNFLRSELEWLRRSPKARTGKQKARIDRAQGALGVNAPQQEQRAQLSIEATRVSKIVIELQDFGLSLGGKSLIEHLDLIVTQSDRLGIIGNNGVGKSSLLRAITGELSPSAGVCRLASNVKLAYLSQTRDNLKDDQSVLENVAEGQSHVTLGGYSRDVRGYLQDFLFDYAKQRQPVASLSGGERTRVALAKLLSRPANLVMLDEPTNDLDVHMLGALEQMLLDYAGCTLIVTHDRWLLDRVATSILAHDSQGHWLRYAGGYSDYRQQLEAHRAQQARLKNAATTEAKRQPTASRGSGRAKASGLTYAERLELEALEPQIAGLEQRVKTLEAELADPETYARAAQGSAPLAAELNQVQGKLETLMLRWEQLELKKELAPGE